MAEDDDCRRRRAQDREPEPREVGGPWEMDEGVEGEAPPASKPRTRRKGPQAFDCGGGAFANFVFNTFKRLL